MLPDMASGFAGARCRAGAALVRGTRSRECPASDSPRVRGRATASDDRRAARPVAGEVRAGVDEVAERAVAVRPVGKHLAAVLARPPRSLPRLRPGTDVG